MLTNCPACNRPLEPAILDSKNRWCSICAVEYNPSGGPVVRQAPKAQGDKAALAAAGPEKSTSPLAPEKPIEVTLGEVHAATAALRASQPRRFRVALNNLSFEVENNAKLQVGETSIVITAL